MLDCVSRLVTTVKLDRQAGRTGQVEVGVACLVTRENKNIQGLIDWLNIEKIYAY